MREAEEEIKSDDGSSSEYSEYEQLQQKAVDRNIFNNSNQNLYKIEIEESY